MPTVHVTVHPRGLHPTDAVLAWHLHTEEGMSIRDVCDEVVNMLGARPSFHAVRSAIQGVKAVHGTHAIPQTKYANCGRRRKLTPEQEAAVVEFVKKWRNKRFCTCNYIRATLKLKVTKRTVSNVLNRQGYFWRSLPKVRGMSVSELAKRKAWVDMHLDKTPAWWQEHMGLVLDGVTLTMAPKTLSERERHMAQSIKYSWMHVGEAPSADCYHFNRYGVQLGVKVPLWGGLTGQGRFTFRKWTPQPKMSKAAWATLIPHIRRSVDLAGESRRNVRPKVWHDNERFLLQPSIYKQNGLHMQCFPPNSGDLNPIETVWAWLRRDLAIREQEDFYAKRVLTARQFRLRAAQLLRTYEDVRPGQQWSRLAKLVRGMTKRLRKCKAKQYGRCGK